MSQPPILFIIRVQVPQPPAVRPTAEVSPRPRCFSSVRLKVRVPAGGRVGESGCQCAFAESAPGRGRGGGGSRGRVGSGSKVGCDWMGEGREPAGGGPSRLFQEDVRLSHRWGRGPGLPLLLAPAGSSSPPGDRPGPLPGNTRVPAASWPQTRPLLGPRLVVTQCEV